MLIIFRLEYFRIEYNSLLFHRFATALQDLCSQTSLSGSTQHQAIGVIKTAMSSPQASNPSTLVQLSENNTGENVVEPPVTGEQFEMFCPYSSVGEKEKVSAKTGDTYISQSPSSDKAVADKEKNQDISSPTDGDTQPFPASSLGEKVSAKTGDTYISQSPSSDKAVADKEKNQDISSPTDGQKVSPKAGGSYPTESSHSTDILHQNSDGYTQIVPENVCPSPNEDEEEFSFRDAVLLPFSPLTAGAKVVSPETSTPRNPSLCRCFSKTPSPTPSQQSFTDESTEKLISGSIIDESSLDSTGECHLFYNWRSSFTENALNLTDCDDCEELQYQMKFSGCFQATSWQPGKRKREIYSDDSSSSGPVDKKLYRKSRYWKPEPPKKPKQKTEENKAEPKACSRGVTMYDSRSPYYHHLFRHVYNLCQEAQKLRIDFGNFEELSSHILRFDTEHLSKDDMLYVHTELETILGDNYFDESSRDESTLFSTDEEELSYSNFVPETDQDVSYDAEEDYEIDHSQEEVVSDSETSKEEHVDVEYCKRVEEDDKPEHCFKLKPSQLGKEKAGLHFSVTHSPTEPSPKTDERKQAVFNKVSSVKRSPPSQVEESITDEQKRQADVNITPSPLQVSETGTERKQAHVTAQPCQVEKSKTDEQKIQADVNITPSPLQVSKTTAEKTQAHVTAQPCQVEKSKTDKQKRQADVNITPSPLQVSETGTERKQAHVTAQPCQVEKSKTDEQKRQADVNITPSPLQVSQTSSEKTQVHVTAQPSQFVQSKMNGLKPDDNEKQQFNNQPSQVQDQSGVPEKKPEIRYAVAELSTLHLPQDAVPGPSTGQSSQVSQTKYFPKRPGDKPYVLGYYILRIENRIIQLAVHSMEARRKYEKVSNIL